MGELVRGVVVCCVGVGPVPCGLRAVTIAVTGSGEPWAIRRGGVEDGA